MEAVDGRGRELAQLAVQQQLRAAYGIKAKKGKPLRSGVGGAAKGKIFGIPLHELPQQNVPEYGNIPCFLVEVCKYLEKHMHTEGLFRKSGSVVRMKTLKSKLDQGESSMSDAQPCDVAGLLKQFFRELPEPILPTNLQDALIKAQQLNSEERISATLLLSCLINDKSIDTLRYIFKFLKNVSLRSAENKMDSSNLAVIFAPNLLQSSELDKMTTHAEKKLRLQAAVLQTFIDHADKIGLLPKPIMEKIPTMLGIDDPGSTPSLQDYGESEIQTPGEHMRKRRQSIGDVVSGALNKFKSNRTPSTTPQRDTCAFAPVTPVIVTPSSKRKYPADSSQGFSSKKRRSIRHNMGLELLPNSLFSLSSTPGSVQFESSPASLEASQNSLSISASGENHLLNIGNRRSKRIASKKVQRADSGKMGCFSPKISRKEMVRRSLRLKFILGRSSKEYEKNSGKEHSASNRSENIGRRLASQQDMESGFTSVKTSALFSPYVGPKNSKSEENLKILKSNQASNRMSWTGPCSTESQETCRRGSASMARCEAEPVLTTRELPVIPFKTVVARTEQDDNKRQTSFYEDENNVTADTLLKIKKAFSQSGSNLHNLLETETSKSNSTVGKMCLRGHNLERDHFKTTAQKMSNVEQKTIFTNSANESSGIDKFLSSTDEINSVEGSLSPNSAEMDYAVRSLHENEDQPVARISSQTQLNSTNTLQKEILESTEQFITEGVSEVKGPIYCKLETETGRCLESKELLSLLPEEEDRTSKRYLHLDVCEKSKPSPSGKVADHIHWFNKLSLNEPCSATKTKPPLNFQRTPVRHSIRKMNSLLEADKKTVTCKLIKAGDDCSSLVRSVSYETALSSYVEGMSKTSSATSLPSVPTCKQMSTCDHLARSSKSFQQLEKASRDGTNCKEAVTTANHPKSALEDLTNYEAPKIVLKANASMRVSGAKSDKCALRKTEIKARYRGSPKNPIATSKLLPVVKPLDL